MILAGTLNKFYKSLIDHMTSTNIVLASVDFLCFFGGGCAPGELYSICSIYNTVPFRGPQLPLYSKAQL